MSCSTIFPWCHACLTLEEHAEGGGAGEVEVVGDFAGHHLFVFQHDLGLQDGSAVNPVHHAVAADLRDKGGKVMRSNGEALGIEGDGALTGAMLVDERTELLEELFLSGELRTVLLLLFLYAVDVL